MTMEVSVEQVKNQKKRCEHNKQQSQCKECGGSQICEHDRQCYGISQSSYS